MRHINPTYEVFKRDSAAAHHAGRVIASDADPAGRGSVLRAGGDSIRASARQGVPVHPSMSEVDGHGRAYGSAPCNQVLRSLPNSGFEGGTLLIDLEQANPVNGSPDHWTSER
jgi:hypothetical protein